MFCTFFAVFDIPVFWPILLLYFLTLFAITMKRQIRVSVCRHATHHDPRLPLQHMIKHGYVPWTRGKTRYSGKEDTGKIVYSK